jgi:hypothetical protein
MVEKYFWIAGSSIFIVLGTIHLLYTFFTKNFSVRDKNVEEGMKTSFPVLTKQTTMWKAWIGFNASHSIGAIFFGLTNIFLAIDYFEVLQGSVFMLLITCFVSLFYLFLGIKFWFSVPRTGILISVFCFIIASIIILNR